MLARPVSRALETQLKGWLFLGSKLVMRHNKNADYWVTVQRRLKERWLVVPL